MAQLDTQSVVNLVRSKSVPAVNDLNAFTQQVFLTRGGRVGSGMGLLLEGLWGFFLNRQLRAGQASVEVAWLGENQYNDFACISVVPGVQWDPGTRAGEVFRIEAKSMLKAADESKAHFDPLISEIGADDLILVLAWAWVSDGSGRVFPKVENQYLGNARQLARYRDDLHLLRGGSFVQSGSCPDQCAPGCVHVGEPLNANGKRERVTGPSATRVSRAVSFAANFGGLTRMVAARSRLVETARTNLEGGNAEGANYRRFVDDVLR